LQCDVVCEEVVFGESAGSNGVDYWSRGLLLTISILFSWKELTGHDEGHCQIIVEEHNTGSKMKSNI
jgi:hypothetical protein